MTSYYTELDEDRADELEAWEDERRERKAERRSVAFASRVASRTQHRPANDAEAKALITRLDHFVWETRKVSGRYTQNPYSLVAVIDGVQHTIHLPGRFGSTLTWLMGQVDEREKRES